jgi:serine/threonine protein kinase
MRSPVQQLFMSRSVQNFAREVVVWRQLSHPDVLPFYGVYHWDKNPARVCLISPWTENGNIVQFLRRNPEADRASLVGHSKTSQISGT